MIVGSLMDRGEMFQVPPPFWPEEPIWENYSGPFRALPVRTYMRNSI